jgi:PAS domain S-box-containing protein
VGAREKEVAARVSSELELTSLQRFLRRFLIGAAVVDVAHLGMALLLGSVGLLVSGATIAALLVAVFFAWRLARAGRAETSALTVSYALLVTVVIVTPFVAFAYATLVLTCLLAVTVATPFSGAGRMRAVILSALWVVAYVVLLGLWMGERAPLPSWARDVLVVVTVLVVVYLISHLVMQLRRRLTAMLESEREAHATLGALIDASPAPIATLRLDGTLEAMNPAATRVFGWRAEEVRGEAPPFLGPEQRRTLRELLGEVRSRREIVGRELRCRRRDGGGVEVELWLAPVELPTGETHAVAIALDVTQRNEARRALEEQQRETQEAYRLARTADRRKDEFVAMLGHELRNPLSTIVTALELMRPANGDGAGAREREVIERQVRYMTRLVDDLLDLSRIARGKLSLERRTQELASAVRAAVEIATPLIERKGHALRVEVPERGLPVFADPTRLAQVVSNLLTNAAKYTPSGGHITVRGERRGERVRLAVRDDGIGMTPELRARVFDLFAQGAQDAGGAGGLGLGLTLARSLTEMHGGWIEAESEGPGRGSCFAVTLPLAAEAVKAEPPRGRPPRAGEGQRRPRVLVVDDNEDAAELLAQTLSLRGYEVRVAFDGREALRAVAEDPPDAAVLDIGLPGMDGYELAERLRETVGERPVGLVALTGYGQEADRERSARAGFGAHLVKPVDLGELERCLCRAVGEPEPAGSRAPP